ncbi:IclR family transcriptional regulator [Actinomycetospora sp. NBRC 106375]|uniref:IclR family transcriptional regulator n=1 Tax=Actinomycetospora sp. NBRC 106375 TaxID=3032207 RepID=UPI0024A1AB09|nr:IclR family transcriptional regulator [Actinomycetospora sp. NBRC 106375]GLZ45416.1 IclR family transcriptional regulator [Actinomycetospora sp. NBRC 106375]
MERNPDTTAEDQALPTYAIESVDKALQILVMLRERRRVRVVDVGEELGVARSTAHRLLATLAHRGFVVRDPRDRSYRGGPELLGLGAVGEVDLRAAAGEHVRALSARLRETVNVMVLEGASCRFLDGVAGERPLGTRVRTGAVLPAHIVSGGKALLAELPPREVDALFGSSLRRITPATIVDVDALHAELRRIREQGYAVNREESEPGLSAVAVVVRAGTRAVGAVAVSAPTQRLDDDGLATALEELHRTTAAIGAELG